MTEGSVKRDVLSCPRGSQVIFAGVDPFDLSVGGPFGRLTDSPRFLSRQTDVAHVSHRVVVVHGRFLPLWMRDPPPVRRRENDGVGKPDPRIRQQVVEALTLAGFEVEFQEAWLAMKHKRALSLLSAHAIGGWVGSPDAVDVPDVVGPVIAKS